MPADALVVGAGLGGLSAAIHLAALGRRVVVLERNETVGGKAGEVIEAGFRWDTGPSVLTMRAVLDDLFAAAGRRLQDYLDLLPVDPLTRCFFPDGSRLDLRQNPARTLEGVAALEPADAAGFGSFLAHAARLSRITAPVFTMGPRPGPASLTRIAIRDALYALPSVLRSLDGEIRRRVRSPRLRQVLGRFATYLGSNPFEASGVLAVIAHAELNEGVWYPRGGLRALVRALERLAGELGVEIHTGVEVTRIACSQYGGGSYRVVGAETVAGERFPASAVIANLDAATVYGRLLPPEGRIRRRASRLAAMPPSCSAFALLLGVEGQHPDLAHHNVFFSADYRREFDEIFRLRRPPEYPTVYAAITSKSDPGHAPSGCENWFVLVNVPAAEGGYDWGRRSDEYAGLILRRLADFDLDLGGRIRVRKLITPLDLERLSGARGGSLYGASFNDRLAPLRRPGNRCPEVAGLYLAGGTTHPGGGIPLVLLSGRLAARMICGVE